MIRRDTMLAANNWTNMASFIFSCLLCILCVYPLCSKSAKTRVELSTPVHPVTVGGILAIQCQVWNTQDSYKVNLFRIVNEDTEQITYKENYDSDSSLGQRGFLAKRTFSDGSVVLFLTVVDISPSDEGEYLCKVHSVVRGTFNDIAEDTTAITIFSFPDKIFPSCSITSNKIRISAGERMTLGCKSQQSFPVVNLNWNCINGDIPFTIHNSQEGEMEISEITLTLHKSYNGAVFECKMTSSGFPEKVRSCTIGPLNIAHTSNDIDKPTQNNVHVLESQPNVDLVSAGKCGLECPPENKYVLLYWAVATVGTTILMLVFLTTTVIYCCKYQTMSAEVISAQGSFTSCDGTEPVYVSLQRRQLPERNSMYMSVEDPNNPGNKVLMPREVFDEFYRSLSLKKRDRQTTQGSVYE